MPNTEYTRIIQFPRNVRHFSLHKISCRFFNYYFLDKFKKHTPLTERVRYFARIVFTDIGDITPDKQ